jgi:hypothetical protein
MGKRRNKRKRNSSFYYFEHKDTNNFAGKNKQNYNSTSSCTTTQVRDIAEEVFGDRYTYRVNSNG